MPRKRAITQRRQNRRKQILGSSRRTSNHGEANNQPVPDDLQTIDTVLEELLYQVQINPIDQQLADPNPSTVLVRAQAPTS